MAGIRWESAPTTTGPLGSGWRGVPAAMAGHCGGGAGDRTYTGLSLDGYDRAPLVPVSFSPRAPLVMGSSWGLPTKEPSRGACTPRTFLKSRDRRTRMTRVSLRATMRDSCQVVVTTALVLSNALERGKLAPVGRKARSGTAGLTTRFIFQSPSGPNLPAEPGRLARNLARRGVGVCARVKGRHVKTGERWPHPPKVS